MDFMAFVWALPPTRLTEMPTLMAGRTLELKRSDSRKIWPSVMEMTLVGMYAETSPAWVSMKGRAVSEPAPYCIGAGSEADAKTTMVYSMAP